MPITLIGYILAGSGAAVLGVKLLTDFGFLR